MPSVIDDFNKKLYYGKGQKFKTQSKPMVLFLVEKLISIFSFSGRSLNHRYLAKIPS